MIIPVSSDKGLCGGINSTVVKVSKVVSSSSEGDYFAPVRAFFTPRKFARRACRSRRRGRLMKATMMERAKETASRAKDAAANAAKHDPKFAGLLTAGGALLSETKKKFEESRGALMLSTFDKLEPKLAGFMLHVYATKIKPGLTTDKWMPESMRSDTRSNCEARQACY